MSANPITLPKNARILLLHDTPALGYRMMATPMLRSLRRHYPDAALFVATDGKGVSFYKGNNLGIRTLNVDDQMVMRTMKGGRIDVCISPYLQEGLYLDVLLSGCVLEKRIGEGQNLDWRITAWHSHERESAQFTHETNIFSNLRDPVCPGEYMGKMFLKYLEPLGIFETDARPQIWSTEEDVKAITGYLGSKGFGGNDFVLGVNIGGRNHRWPVNMIAKFLRHFEYCKDQKTEQLLKGRQIKYIVTVGSYQEEHFWSQLSDFTGLFGSRLIQAQTYTPGRLAAAIARCSYFVTTETGSAHVAQALDIPSTVLYPSEEWMNSWLFPGARVKPVFSKTTIGSVEGILPEEVNMATCKGICEWIK
jgi:ADP-heptose:LPS heptosyltransferase